MEVVFHFFLLLSFEKKLKLSLIFKDIEVVYHISSSWVKRRLRTENLLHGLPQNFLLWVVVVPTALCGHTNFVFGLKLGCNNSLSHKLQLTVEDS
jgi:hypothetical protein